ncbi:hypothetical protein C8F04DRAFT_1155424 [Mycena alexandri]|uniref:F-box domain-containing protein n=1 Tax=Mycena alexandri TaxID=1745969 RepID=A0AAD6WKT3_9AGAR|nr:hypothetical protein C8F04DRAFT_1155424 [Mycena alexandri]
MVTRLVDLPADIIFYVLSKMRLEDAWSFTATSRTFRELTADRGFWLNALKSNPAMRSASNPLILQQLDLQTLKQLALHSIKLDCNWSLPRPRVIGEVRRWDLGDRSILETNHLFRFPGSELFIFHSSKHLKCFNFGTGQFTTILDLDAYVRCASYDFLPDKSVILGLAELGGSDFKVPILQYIKIELSASQSQVAATILLQPTLARDSDCLKPFVSSRIVGAVQTRGGGTEILAYDLLSGGSATIVTDIPNNYAISRRLDFSFYKESLYILADDGPKALVYCCPRQSLPYGRKSATASMLTFGDMDPVSFPTKIWKRRGAVCSQMLRDANFVKIHDGLGIPLSKFVTTFRFWLRADRDLGPEIFREITVTGMCSGELTMQMAPAGYHIVASLLDPGKTGCDLVLLRFNPDSNSCSSHELEIPTGVGVGPPPNVLAVDDHRGLVWLVDRGDLLAIPYA